MIRSKSRTRRRGWPATAATLALLALGPVACTAADTGKKKPSPPLVAAAPAQPHVFTDRIEAVGTARANEQVTIAAAVTERVERLLFDDGMFVKRGQLLAALTHGQEQAALEGAAASQRLADAQLRRISELRNQGFATQALYDQQVATSEQALANADRAKADISDRMIRAPFAGYASLRTLSEGSIVNAGTPLVTISDVSRIKLDFTVPETRLADLRVGQEIEAIAAAFPEEPFVGRISSIDPVIDPSSRAVLVRAILPNPGARIKPGMLMNVRVQLARRIVPAVPELAVLAEGDKRYVFVVGSGGKAKRVDVTTGLRDNGMLEVQGIPPGAAVIGEGVVKVSDGARVRMAEGEGKPPGKGKS